MKRGNKLLFFTTNNMFIFLARCIGIQLIFELLNLTPLSALPEYECISILKRKFKIIENKELPYHSSWFWYRHVFT